MDSKQLLAEALRLTDEERAALAGELIQSLDAEVDADAEAAWAAEIRTRLDQVDAGNAATIPWAEARRRIHAAAERGSRASVGGQLRWPWASRLRRSVGSRLRRS